MTIGNHLYLQISQLENIFNGFSQFRKGKTHKKDVVQFEYRLEENLFNLHQKLTNKTYLPKSYQAFYINDPKQRIIHKACVEDRIVHHLVSFYLEKIFDPSFIYHSYSCRKNKGTHKAVVNFQKLALNLSKNNKITCWVLKCDIKKFFHSLDHQKLLEILKRKINDQDFLNLLIKIVVSFNPGIPIGNLTSQFFANIYLNELDQFITQKLKIKAYIRYADDFVILSENRDYLENLLSPIEAFLNINLKLELHPNKIIFRKFRSGVDFLGYIIFPYHILPRTKTKRRLMKKIKQRVYQYQTGQITKEGLNQTVQSYLGFLSHANTYKFRRQLEKLFQESKIKIPNI